MTIGNWSHSGPRCWNDVLGHSALGCVIEWSADCNGDGIVDFGQIRSGQLADLNADNIPDVCQCPTPHVVRVPQDAASIAAAVALACPNIPMEIVLAPGTWPMEIDTGDSAISLTIRGLDKSTTIVTSAGAGTLMNARYGSSVLLKSLTVADAIQSGSTVEDIAWELFFDDCIVRNCSGAFIYSTASTRPAAVATRFESCTGSSYAVLYLGAHDVTNCDFVNCSRAIVSWGFTNISNCRFSGTNGHAVQARDSFSMSGCDFTNTAGAAIQCVQTSPISASLSACQFTAGTDSAVVDTHFSPPTDTTPAGNWNISGCGFYGNSATGDGGAIRVGINRSVTLTNSEWINNSTGGSGGAFAQAFGGWAQTFVAAGCTFTGNQAPAGGGGALTLAGWEGDAVISETNFVGNHAVAGGALRCDRTALSMNACLFEGNGSTEAFVDGGGAILIELGAGAPGNDDMIRNSTFRNNATLGRGGAVSYYFYATTGIADCVFEGNSAGTVGGALSVISNCHPRVQRCSFSGNTAAQAGSAVFTGGVPTSSLTRIDACRFSEQPTTASGVRAVEAFMPIELGGTSFCASGPDPYAGSISEYVPNCVASSCEDLDGNGRPDECDLFHDVPSQFPTIQAAIDATPAGVHRIVRVAAGTYNEAFALNGKDVVVRGAPNHATILDGTGLTTSIARFTGDEPATAGVENLVFRNGTAGSQIYPKAPFRVGGALYAAFSSAFVRNCEFRQNRSGFGGAMYCYLCRTVIDGSTFIGNIADDEGGAILTFETTATVRNSGFDGNRCGAVNPGSGSGLKSVGARGAGETVLLDNCSFTNGVAGVNGAAVEHYENTVSVPGKLRILNCDIVGNSSGIGAAGVRVLGSMQSCTVAAGTTICGNSGRNIDGPFFIEGAVTICDCLADLARDGSVNGGDLGMLLSAWGLANAQGIGDANHNGVVDGEDLSIVLSSWGACP